MPSQEDYLDNLLKDMEKEEISNTEEASELEIAELTDLLSSEGETGSLDEDVVVTEDDISDLLAGLGLDAGFGEESSDAISEEVEKPNDDSVYLDAVSGMTEDEIEQLLASGEEIFSNVSAEELSENDLNVDVVEMLQDADDSDLQEIQELLQKSDNDEIVDEDVQALFFGIGAEEESPADKLMAEIENGEEAPEEMEASKRKDKERKKEELAAKSAEKKASKKAAKEAKKAERENAKAEKEAAKRAKKSAKAEKETAKPEQEAVAELDTETLDSIVFGAGNLGNEEILETTDVMDNMTEDSDPLGVEFAELFGAGSLAEDVAGDATEDAVVVDDSLGIDLESLFGVGDFSGENGTTEAVIESSSKDKSAKEKSAKEKNPKEKKGIFAKLVDFLTEEEEEEPKNENIHLSAENEEILKDLDKQKGKKKIKKKGKGAEKTEDNEGEEKPKKKTKPKKEKKLKKVKVVAIDEYFEQGKKLTFKKVLPVILLGVTIGVVIMLVSGVSIDVIDKRQAKEAFYNGDYYTCFENLYGKELDETEEVMYGKSESILYIRLWYREYEMFAEEGLEVEALDSLIQTVEDYPMLYEYASQWNATQEVYEVYSKIVTILNEKYGLTEVQAMEIADIKRDKDYTKVVTIIANGGTYGSYGGSVEETIPEADTLPDELPEESGMNQGGFIDNR